MEETLNYCIHGTQAYVELPYSQNAVTRRGLSTSFLILARCTFVLQTDVCTTKVPCSGTERGLLQSRIQRK